MRCAQKSTKILENFSGMFRSRYVAFTFTRIPHRLANNSSGRCEVYPEVLARQLAGMNNRPSPKRDRLG